MIKTRYWIIGILAVLFACIIAVFFIYGQDAAEGNIRAEIYLDGECIEIIDLSKVTEPYSFTVEGTIGENVISVEQNRICVSEADCPDKVCVDHGWETSTREPIICLPNRLVIRLALAEESDIDGVVS